MKIPPPPITLHPNREAPFRQRCPALAVHLAADSWPGRGCQSPRDTGSCLQIAKKPVSQIAQRYLCKTHRLQYRETTEPRTRPHDGSPQSYTGCSQNSKAKDLQGTGDDPESENPSTQNLYGGPAPPLACGVDTMDPTASTKVCQGALGNCVFFLLYAYSFLCKPRLRKPIAMVFMHLNLVKALTIIFESIPFIVSSYGVLCFLDDATCKAMLFLFRVRWGLSACTTTFLSTLQVLTISRTPAQHTPSPIISSIVLRDALSMVLMVAPSLYMVRLLYRHRCRAWHLHSPSLASQPAPKNTATHTNLLLVSCFVFFYCSNSIVTGVPLMLSFSYPTLCPFLLMKNNRMVSRWITHSCYTKNDPL
ncbi:PREDICTED: vomeronasal type-1 receptor 94-like [Dipodomys ordii]|uniref:Vomeronasal type-1 receptor n=1 Tax=Dipodomys ordii TaxID=10020 RepID=A0A1S3GTJ3_DIPOR|nr:PREDICTED: vomeronasal type-1 receptor 94-like [Dipodomys ordii]